jgi:hypothetical protein
MVGDLCFMLLLNRGRTSCSLLAFGFREQKEERPLEQDLMF